MFLTVNAGKVYSDRYGRRYGTGHEIDVDEKTGESLIRNEIAQFSEKYKEQNYKLKSIKLDTRVFDKDGSLVEDLAKPKKQTDIPIAKLETPQAVAPVVPEPPIDPAPIQPEPEPEPVQKEIQKKKAGRPRKE